VVTRVPTNLVEEGPRPRTVTSSRSAQRGSRSRQDGPGAVANSTGSTTVVGAAQALEGIGVGGGAEMLVRVG
jgi:hypothetical protein